MNFLYLLVVFVFCFLAYLGFARIANNQKEWKEERKTAYEMAFWGAGVIVIIILISSF